MGSLNPFHGLSRPKAVWAWGMYDLANQSFQLLINTLLFSIYLAKVVAADDEQGKLVWAGMFVASNTIVVLLSPLLGAIADQKAWKREILLGTGFLCVALMSVFPALGPGMTILAVAFYVPAAVACGIGENFLGAFLPEIAEEQNMGRVSALGWSMSYAGALVLLLAVLAAVKYLGWMEPTSWRWLFLFAAVWFLAGMLPTVFFLKEQANQRPRTGAPPTPVPHNHGSLVAQGFRRLRDTLSHTKRHRELARFLGVFFIYSLGTQTIVFFAGLIGADIFQGDIVRLILMALVMAVTAGLGAVLTGLYQDRLGHRRTVVGILLVWVLSTLALGVVRVADLPLAWFWVVSGGIGLGLGGIGTASRAMVGVMTPPSRAGEFFGLWGMIYKLASFGGLGFAFASAQLGDAGLFVITAFFGAGLVLMTFVDEKRGIAEAKGETADFPTIPAP